MHAGPYAKNDRLFILFDEPQRGITPGQFAVWYEPTTPGAPLSNADELTGSGVIA